MDQWLHDRWIELKGFYDRLEYLSRITHTEKLPLMRDLLWDLERAATDAKKEYDDF